MESPSVILFALFFFLGDHHNSLISWIFLLIWASHYFHRAFIYPHQRRGKQKRMPLSIVMISIIFNGVNCYLNARWLFHFSGGCPSEWYLDLHFIFSIVIFIIGFIINRHSDYILQTLRKPGENTYKIPQGGTYNLIASPNCLGEIIQRCGWALATWSVAGLSFAWWTFVNLIPRAKSNLKWYCMTFNDFPKERKALFPWIW